MTLYIKDTLKGSISGNAGTSTKLQTARAITIGSKSLNFDGSAALTYTLTDIGAAASGHTHSSIVNQDTRSENTAPADVPLGLSVHLKSNGTDGLSDGGTYHPSLMIKPWNDKSGWPIGQLSITQNNNLWFRSSNADGTTWNDWKKVSLNGHTHSYLPLSGGTMTGPIINGSMAGSWVDAANSKSIINSARSAGGFSPLASAATTNGKMVLAMYQGSLQCAYLTKEHCDANTNTVTRSTYLMDESGAMSVGGNLTTAGTLTVNGGDVHNINRINFRSHSDDGAWIKTTVDGAITMMDFGISDDAGQDRFRWIGNLYNSADGSHPDRVAMELYPHLNGSELYLNGSSHTTGYIYMDTNNTSIFGKATDGNFRAILRLTSQNVTDVGNTSGTTCLLGSGSAHPTHYDGSATYTLHSDKNHHWGYFSTNGGQDFLGRGKRCIVATETELVLNYGPDFTRILTHGSIRVNGDSSIGGVGYHDRNITINGVNVSVQSSAPSIGGVWIQI